MNDCENRRAPRDDDDAAVLAVGVVVLLLTFVIGFVLGCCWMAWG